MKGVNTIMTVIRHFLKIVLKLFIYQIVRAKKVLKPKLKNNVLMTIIDRIKDNFTTVKHILFVENFNFKFLLVLRNMKTKIVINKIQNGLGV